MQYVVVVTYLDAKESLWVPLRIFGCLNTHTFKNVVSFKATQLLFRHFKKLYSHQEFLLPMHCIKSCKCRSFVLNLSEQVRLAKTPRDQEERAEHRSMIR